MNKVPMTEAGFKNLQDELKKLVNKKRPAIIAAITEARGHGDLSENAEYQYAKEQQSLIESKISELQNTIVSPHCAGATLDNFDNIAERPIANIRSILKNEKL